MTSQSFELIKQLRRASRKRAGRALALGASSYAKTPEDKAPGAARTGRLRPWVTIPHECVKRQLQRLPEEICRRP